MATDITMADKHLNGVHRFRFTITKDGVAWTDIDSVLLTFEKPDRETQFERSATLEGTNIWYYDTVAADLDTAGSWTLAVKATDGAVILTYPHEIGFRVRGNP